MTAPPAVESPKPAPQNEPLVLTVPNANDAWEAVEQLLQELPPAEQLGSRSWVSVRSAPPDPRGWLARLTSRQPQLSALGVAVACTALLRRGYRDLRVSGGVAYGRGRDSSGPQSAAARAG